MSNSKQWRKRGYKTIIRDENIYLYRPATGIILWTPVNQGHWMNYEDVNQEPWVNCNLTDLPERLQKSIREATENCYCDKGVGLCDFCAGKR